MTPTRRPEREAHQLAAGPPPRAGGTPLLAPPPDGLAEATFGGGCFWCTESDMQRIDGVDIAISGYTGGAEISPTYREVAGGATGHVEAVRVFHDPAQVTYEQLLAVYWRHIDPTDDQGQFADRGAHYRPVIYVHDEEQRRLATASRDAVAASGRFDRPIVVAIEDAGDFWIAEEEHQNFYLERPAHYERYRRGSGRTRFIERTWGR
ncbi:MAG: peptide-methionine (S)-S-oxide reductase [Deltaproteobacteria bacterium]|nr:MAG: peptide-methionine (S)-S-oxide reductase [Deltaproteobacteria bacterium]